MIFGIDSYFKGIDMHLYQVSNYTGLLRALKRILSAKRNRGSLSIQGQLKIYKFSVGIGHTRCGKNIQEEGLTPVFVWFLISERSICILGNAYTARINAKKKRKVTFTLTLPNRKHAFLINRYHTHYS